MLEYLDAILRKGVARLPAVAEGLRANARRLGLDPQRLGGDLEQSIRDTLRLGAEDVLLDELLALVGQTPGDLAALRQAAAFALPVEAQGLAFALADGEPSPVQVTAAEASARRLIGTSLLTPLSGDLLWVHRWTAQEIRDRLDPSEARECSRRAGEYRAWRVANVSHDLSDGIEATRRFLEAQAFDRAAEMAEPVLQFMVTYGQLVDVAAFAGEVLETLPATHPRYFAVALTQGDALMVLGATDQAMARYKEGHAIMERLARAEPGRADYQRDLSVSYERMGELYRALGQGEAAQAAFQKALEIRERLARAEPGRADYQWDLFVSLWRAADIAEDGGAAHLERALGILRRLDAAGALYPEQREWIPRLEQRLRG
jgi:hypothetical protein